MPKIDLIGNYVDGSAFPVDGHNKNIYDVVTSAGHERGILSTPNGGLEYDPAGTTKNLPETFTLYSEHVQRKHGIWGSARGNFHPRDLSEEVFSDGSKAEYVRTPGPCIRFNVNRDADAVLYWVHMFIAWNKPTFDNGIALVEPDIIIRPVVDGIARTELARTLNATNAYNDHTASGKSDITYRNMESRNARWYSLCLLDNDVAEGRHEIGVEIYIEKSEVATTYDRNFGLGATDGVTITPGVIVKSRVTFGVTNAGFLVL